MAPKKTPVPLSQLPSLSALYSKGALSLQEGTTARYAPSKSFNQRVHLWQGDMTRLQVDGIVNAANQSLMGGGGIDGAIHSVAGPSLQAYNRTLKGCQTGRAKISPGFNLPSKFVISTVGPIYHHYDSEEEAEKVLGSCYESVLKVGIEVDSEVVVEKIEVEGNEDGDEGKENKETEVKEVAAEKRSGKTQRGLESLSFCGISTGIYGFPLKDATEVALKTVREFLEKDPDQELIKHIIFTCFPDKDMQMYESLLPIYFPPTEEDLKAAKEEYERNQAEKETEMVEEEVKV